MHLYWNYIDMAVSRALYSGLIDSRKFRNAVALSAFIEGGIITRGGGYTIHTFTTLGNNLFSVYADNVSVEYLIVAGGGQAGVQSAGCGSGGGGAGGALYANSTILTRGNGKTLSVGAGGTGNGDPAVASTNGQNSVFNGITATGGGGGGGGGVGNNGSSGGSGGGGGVQNGNPSQTRSGGSGVAGQGNAGGNGFSANRYPNQPQFYNCGGGGGGAAGPGGSAFFVSGPDINTFTTAGGSPLVNNILAQAEPGASYAAGGLGQGTASTSNIGNGAAGTNNSGNGGNAGGAAGGSGIVIFRYLSPI